jgi:hypothetical protein
LRRQKRCRLSGRIAAALELIAAPIGIEATSCKTVHVALARNCHQC